MQHVERDERGRCLVGRGASGRVSARDQAAADPEEVRRPVGAEMDELAVEQDAMPL